jgi:hypothetical protein
LAEGLKPWQVLTEGEKIRRRELVRDSKSALEQGLTLEQYVAKREQTVDDWVRWLHAKASEHRNDHAPS